MTPKPLVRNIFILIRPEVANFVDVIKIVTMFIKKKVSKKVKELKLMYQNESISVFSDIAKFSDFRLKNADVSTTQGVYHVIHIFFRFSLGKV